MIVSIRPLGPVSAVEVAGKDPALLPYIVGCSVLDALPSPISYLYEVTG